MKTLIWKEWREQRLFFFLAIGIIILNRIAPSFFPGRVEDKAFYAVASSYFILPGLFSLFLGAISFTNEFARNTKSFLLSQPLTSRRLFWTKFFFGFILLSFLVLLAHLVVSVPSPPDLKFFFSINLSAEERFFFGLFLRLFPVIVYFVACFSSLLLKNSLPAIISTPFILVLGLLPILPLSVVLFLMSSSWVMFYFLAFSVLIVEFLIFNFLTWQNAIVKDVSPAKIILTVSFVIFLFSLGILLILPLSVVLLLISPSLIIFYFLISFTLIAVLFLLGFLIRYKIVVKGLFPVRAMLTAIGVISLFSFGIHAIANLVTSRELNKTIQQAKSEGVKLTLQEVIPPLVPDKDNAALVYQQAFDLADKLFTEYKNKEWNYMPYESGIPLEKLTPTQKNTISKIMKDPEFSRLYALIEKAVSLPSCRFDIKYEDGPTMRLSHLAKMRNLTRLIAARTYILTWEGRYNEALKAATTGLSLGDSLTNEPIIISQLVRVATDKVAMDPFQGLFNNSAVTIYIRDYQNLISEIDRKNKHLTKSLEGELATVGNWIFPNAGRALTGTDFTNFHYKYGKFNLIKQILWVTYRNYLGGPLRKNDNAFYVQSSTNLIGLSQKPFFQVKNNVVDQWDRWDINIGTASFITSKHIISSMMLPSSGGILKEQARYTASLDSFKLVLALKIYRQGHGNYPEKLASIAPEIIPELPLDPFTGKDYIYRKEGRGFLLYSIGPNGRDDNGVYDQKQSQKFDDIAWKAMN